MDSNNTPPESFQYYNYVPNTSMTRGYSASAAPPQPIQQWGPYRGHRFDSTPAIYSSDLPDYNLPSTSSAGPSAPQYSDLPRSLHPPSYGPDVYQTRAPSYGDFSGWSFRPGPSHEVGPGARGEFLFARAKDTLESPRTQAPTIVASTTHEADGKENPNGKPKALRTASDEDFDVFVARPRALSYPPDAGVGPLQPAPIQLPLIPPMPYSDSSPTLESVVQPTSNAGPAAPWEGICPHNIDGLAKRMRHWDTCRYNPDKIITPCPMPGCDKQFSGGRSDNIRNHLKSKHGLTKDDPQVKQLSAQRKPRRNAIMPRAPRQGAAPY